MIQPDNSGKGGKSKLIHIMRHCKMKLFKGYIKIPGGRFVIGGDFNEKNTQW